MSLPATLIAINLVVQPAEMADVRPFEGSPYPAEDAFFEVEIIGVGRMPEDKADSQRIYVKLPNGSEIFEWANTWKDANGNPLPGLTDTKIGGRKAGWLTILMSCGWPLEQIQANAWHHGWLLFAKNGSKKARIAYFAPAPGLNLDKNGNPQPEFVFMTPKIFDEARARGEKPNPNLRPSGKNRRTDTTQDASGGGQGGHGGGAGLPDLPGLPNGMGTNGVGGGGGGGGGGLPGLPGLPAIS